MSIVDVDRLRAALALDDPDVVPDEVLQEVVAAVEGLLLPRLSDPAHAAAAAVREAALGMCVQVWQARHAPGGQMIGGDLGTIVSPHLLGPGLVARFGGLLAPYLRWGGAVIA